MTINAGSTPAAANANASDTRYFSPRAACSMRFATAAGCDT